MIIYIYINKPTIAVSMLTTYAKIIYTPVYARLPYKS